MYSIYYCDKFSFQLSNITEIKNEIQNQLNLCENDYYILQNGKHLGNSVISENIPLHVVPKLFGGKGGFGSMLRAIGAQIEKTTNREACRDLSGRRLRDINEEKRLKTWIEQQVEREKEAKDRKQKKLERLVHIPKHVFKDDSYEKERSSLPEKVEDALEQGLKASTSMGNKRAHETDKNKQKKKPKLWMASDEELSSSSDSENEEKGEQKNEDACSSSSSEQKEENSCSSNNEQKQDETIEVRDDETIEVKDDKTIEVKDDETIEVKDDEKIELSTNTQIEIKST